MSKNYIPVSGILLLSNGIYTSEEGDHRCNLKDGRVIYTNALKRYAVIQTPPMVNDAQDPQEVLSVIDKIAPIVGNYRGLDLIANLKKTLVDRIKTLERERVYKAKVAELNGIYTQVSAELKTKVKYFDRHYHYSDDNRVYNAGLKAEEALNKELSLVSGGAEYAKAYFAIVY